MLHLQLFTRVVLGDNGGSPARLTAHEFDLFNGAFTSGDGQST